MGGKIRILLTLALLCLQLLQAAGQTNLPDDITPSDPEVNMNSPSLLPSVKIGEVARDNDTIQYMELNTIYVYPPKVFKSAKQQRKYSRLVYDVKKVLPIAKDANRMLIETYEYLQTLPTKQARTEHMKRVEASIKAEYTPRMKKLTLRQGKLLIKLIHRQCNSSSYEIIQAFLGPFKAGFYQAFAWVYGASLKKEFDKEGNDRDTERVINLIESGQL